MLPDALKFERYSSLEDIEFLLAHALSGVEARGIDDISRFCQERSVVLASTLHATLAILEYVSLVRKDSIGRYIRSNQNVGTLASVITERAFLRLRDDGALSIFILPEAIEYDSVNNCICLRNNLISLDYSGFKNLLISVGFFKPHALSGNLLQIANELEPLFETKIIQGIKEERFPEAKLRGLSLAALMRMQELNELHGREAEEFVLGYERRRLKGAIAKRVRIISDLQCDAGYDLASFETTSSESVDRFIEVKSFSSKPSFFWSKNEVNVSEIKGDSYFLYLVDRRQMLDEEYQPMIIKNPYQAVFQDKDSWRKDAQSWFFTSAV
jgi:hypothetical protein